MPKAKLGANRLGPTHKPVIFRNPLGSLQLDKPQPKPWQVVPPWFTGSGAEWAVYWALLALRIPFQYQASRMGGRQVKGGLVADFEIPDRRLIIQVQGVYFHYEFGRAQQIRDVMQKAALESMGMNVIFIDEDNALADPKYYVEEALAGRDHSRSARGI